MSALRIHAVLVLVVFFTHQGNGDFIKCIGSEEKCNGESDKCSGSVTFLDEDDKELKKVSHSDDPDTKHGLKTRGGKAIMEGNCCFEARKKKEGTGGQSLIIDVANKEYSLEFKVNFLIHSECVPGASTSWLPIVITLAVIAIVAAVAVVVYMKKRNSGHEPVSTQA